MRYSLSLLNPCNLLLIRPNGNSLLAGEIVSSHDSLEVASVGGLLAERWQKRWSKVGRNLGGKLNEKKMLKIAKNLEIFAR